MKQLKKLFIFYRFIIFGVRFNMELPITASTFRNELFVYPLIEKIYIYAKKIDYVCENN